MLQAVLSLASPISLFHNYSSSPLDCADVPAPLSASQGFAQNEKFILEEGSLRVQFTT